MTAPFFYWGVVRGVRVYGCAPGIFCPRGGGDYGRAPGIFCAPGGGDYGRAPGIFCPPGGGDYSRTPGIFCAPGGGDYGPAPGIFRPPGDGSFSLSVQAAGLRGSRQPLNNPGGRQPSLFLRHSLRPDGPSGCALPGAAVLCAASLPLRPGLRSLLSAPDAGRKTPACQSWFFKKSGCCLFECVQ